MKLNSKTTGFVFPGQGSQAVGMGRDLAAQYPAAREAFERADATLGFALSRIMWDGPESVLNDTVNTQPALFVHSLAAFGALKSLFPDFTAAILAGHSLGELSALTTGGALGFESALKLVRKRGELMQRAGDLNPGGMAAILNLDVAALDKICTEASSEAEVVQVANDNCPGQVVISGSKPAVERAMALAKTAGARRSIPLAVSIAAHSKLMATIQDEWNQAVDAAGMIDCRVPLIGNVKAEAIQAEAALRNDIKLQMQSRVRWTDSVLKATALGIDTFIEVGTGSVLIGLIRRIAPSAQGYALGTPADLAALG